MLKSKAAWALSRPGGRWRSLPSPFSAFSGFTLVGAKYEPSGKYLLFGKYEIPGNTPTSVVAVSTNLTTWNLFTIADYDIYDAATSGAVYFVVGNDFSGSPEPIKRYDAAFAQLTAPTYSATFTAPRNVTWASLSGTDTFIINTTTNYAYSDDDVGDSFTVTSYPSSALGAARQLKYYPETGAYLDLRDSLFPFSHRFSNTAGVFFADTLSFTGNYIVSMRSAYNAATQQYYVINSHVNLSTSAASFGFYIYNSSGVLQYSTSKILPNISSYVVGFVVHAGTQKLYILVYDSRNNRSLLYSMSLSFSSPFYNLSTPLQEFETAIAYGLLVSPGGLTIVQASGQLTVSP